jgi:hypothetical protein
MKKYLLGLFAVVLAIGFSAFTSDDRKSTTQDAYFWYAIDGSQVGQLLDASQYTRADAISFSVVGCSGTTSDLCAIGLPTDDQEGQSLPSVSADQRVHIQP